MTTNDIFIRHITAPKSHTVSGIMVFLLDLGWLEDEETEGAEEPDGTSGCESDHLGTGCILYHLRAQNYS
ncbi:hypothetical protein [Candidatus Paracaedibacter symbiosus]|uniref:hypothetical protein n=1 Tax=Candidatus Paracaedibacter symbiosus TaxID=244582 RepID=UPI00068A2A4D|nr:hypothetical protein [Candidatus Paracaedibacter symbiosus]